jgi:hypothetical protein
MPLKLVYYKSSLPVLFGLIAIAAFLLFSGVSHSRASSRHAADIAHTPSREGLADAGRLP